MTAGEIVEKAFPGKGWTGESYHHRSSAWLAEFDQPIHDQEEAVKVYAQSKYLDNLVGALILGGFPGTVWMVTHEELKSVILAELCSWVIKKAPLSPTGGHLTNQVTGSKFHRIGTKGKVVLGVRAWLSGPTMWENSTSPPVKGIGVRVRVEVSADSEETSRKKARASVEAATQVVKESSLEIEFSPAEEEVPVRQRVKSY